MPTTPATPRHPAARQRIQRWLLKGLAAAALALVFAWYLSPHFAVDMAARFWSCI